MAEDEVTYLGELVKMTAQRNSTHRNSSGLIDRMCLVAMLFATTTMDFAQQPQ